MIDHHAQLVEVLSGILPTHYELMLTADIPTPCISYQERNNYAKEEGDTLRYSRVSYTVKVWSRSVSELQRYALEIDAALFPLGWERISSGELKDKSGGMIQKIMNYEATAYETFKE